MASPRRPRAPEVQRPIVHARCSAECRHEVPSPWNYLFLGPPAHLASKARPSADNSLSEEPQWSSEGEEDAAHATSVRTQLKRAFARALDDDVLASMSRMSLAAKTVNVSECAAALEAMSLDGGYRCQRCQHQFALRKTRDMHTKACKGPL
jgi:hypothetical protein